MTPTASDLLAIMREVRDASSFELNPHVRPCMSLSVLGSGCTCARGRRIVAAWRAFHDALEAGGVPRFEEEP